MTRRIVETEYERRQPVPGYETLFEANRKGEVWALSRYVNSPICGGRRLLPETKLSARRDVSGYWVVDARVPGGRRVRLFIHRIIAALFVDNPHAKPFVNHINGDKGDFSPQNLEWCTHAENMAHARATGLAPPPRHGKGSLSPSAKLSEGDVREIRALSAGGQSNTQIAAQYGVSRGTIGFIVSRATWGHAS